MSFITYHAFPNAPNYTCAKVYISGCKNLVSWRLFFMRHLRLFSKGNFDTDFPMPADFRI